MGSRYFCPNTRRFISEWRDCISAAFIFGSWSVWAIGGKVRAVRVMKVMSVTALALEIGGLDGVEGLKKDSFIAAVWILSPELVVFRLFFWTWSIIFTLRTFLFTFRVALSFFSYIQSFFHTISFLLQHLSLVFPLEEQHNLTFCTHEYLLQYF